MTNYYYDVNVALGEVAIGVVKTDNAEVNAILTAQKQNKLLSLMQQQMSKSNR